MTALGEVRVLGSGSRSRDAPRPRRRSGPPRPPPARRAGRAQRPRPDRARRPGSRADRRSAGSERRSRPDWRCTRSGSWTARRVPVAGPLPPLPPTRQTRRSRQSVTRQRPPTRRAGSRPSWIQRWTERVEVPSRAAAWLGLSSDRWSMARVSRSRAAGASATSGIRRQPSPGRSGAQPGRRFSLNARNPSCGLGAATLPGDHPGGVPLRRPVGQTADLADDRLRGASGRRSGVQEVRDRAVDRRIEGGLTLDDLVDETDPLCPQGVESKRFFLIFETLLSARLADTAEGARVAPVLSVPVSR